MLFGNLLEGGSVREREQLAGDAGPHQKPPLMDFNNIHLSK